MKKTFIIPMLAGALLAGGSYSSIQVPVASAAAVSTVKQKEIVAYTKDMASFLRSLDAYLMAYMETEELAEEKQALASAKLVVQKAQNYQLSATDYQLKKAHAEMVRTLQATEQSIVFAEKYLNEQVTDEEFDHALEDVVDQMDTSFYHFATLVEAYLAKHNIPVNKDIFYVLYEKELPANAKVHRVVKGETLWKVAKLHGTTPQKLMDLNEWVDEEQSYLRLNENIIVGINVSSPEVVTHTVKKGETLYRLAIMYGTSVEKIKSLNGLKSNTVKAGQALKIEKTSKAVVVSVNTHVVKKGETLYSIAKLHHVTVSSLKSLNGLTHNQLSVNQVLTVR